MNPWCDSDADSAFPSDLHLDIPLPSLMIRVISCLLSADNRLLPARLLRTHQYYQSAPASTGPPGPPGPPGPGWSDQSLLLFQRPQHKLNLLIGPAASIPPDPRRHRSAAAEQEKKKVSGLSAFRNRF